MANIGLNTEALPLTAHAKGIKSFFIILIPEGNGKPIKKLKGEMIKAVNTIFETRLNDIR